VQIADLRWFYRSVRGSIGAAAIVLTFDVVLSGSFLVATLVCPIWILVSLPKSAIHRPGWGLALARVLIPALTFLFVRANDTFQLSLRPISVDAGVGGVSKASWVTDSDDVQGDLQPIQIILERRYSSHRISHRPRPIPEDLGEGVLAGGQRHDVDPGVRLVHSGVLLGLVGQLV
jgi:hypothetical protein